jgi:hypothetical protein
MAVQALNKREEVFAGQVGWAHREIKAQALEDG